MIAIGASLTVVIGVSLTITIGPSVGRNVLAKLAERAKGISSHCHFRNPDASRITLRQTC